MRPIDTLRGKLDAEIFTESDARLVLGNGAAYYGKVTRLLESGALIKIRRGLFSFGDPFRRRPINSFLLANTLYGPSYVSLESALSYYGMIPEAVKQVTSVTLKRPKVVTTPVGQFLYRTVGGRAFSVGSISLKVDSHHVIMATLEKAILDKVYLDFQGKNVFEFLTESLRIEERELLRLNVTFLKNLSSVYGQKALSAKISELATELKARR